MSWGEIRNFRLREMRQSKQKTDATVEMLKTGTDNRNIIFGYMSSGASQLSRITFGRRPSFIIGRSRSGQAS